MPLTELNIPYTQSRTGGLYNYYDFRSRVTAWRGIFKGEFTATWEAFRARFVSIEVGAGRGIAKRDFLLVNELRPALERMIEAMPAFFTIGVEEDPEAEEPAEPEGEEPSTSEGEKATADEEPELSPRAQELQAVQQWAETWAASKIAGKGRNLYGLLGAICLRQVRDGFVPLVFHREEGKPVEVRIRDAAHMELKTDPLTDELLEASFSWNAAKVTTEDGKTEYAKMRQVLTREDSQIFQDDVLMGKSPHPAGRVPLVLVPLRYEEDSLLSCSAVEGLLEAYLAFLHAHYLFNLANKYEAHGMYCPDPRVESDANLDDDDDEAGGEFESFPGAYYSEPITKVGGGVDPDTFNAQIDRLLQTLHHLAKVRLESQLGTDQRSGKAKLVDSAEMKADVDIRTGILRDKLGEVFELVWLMEKKGEIPEGGLGLTFHFPMEEEGDSQEDRERADLVLKARQAGECTREQFWELWQHLGMIDDDADPAKWAAAAEEDAEAKAAEESARLADQLTKAKARQGKPGDPAAGAKPPPFGAPMKGAEGG